VRRRYGVKYELAGTDARVHRLVRIAALSVVVVMVAWVFLAQLIETSLDWIGPRMDGPLILLRLFSGVVFIGATAIGLWNAWSVLHSKRRWVAKVWSVLLALALLTVLYVALIFHLIGYSANY
jgi:hypothetical protein